MTRVPRILLEKAVLTPWVWAGRRRCIPGLPPATQMLVVSGGLSGARSLDPSTHRLLPRVPKSKADMSQKRLPILPGVSQPSKHIPPAQQPLTRTVLLPRLSARPTSSPSPACGAHLGMFLRLTSSPTSSAAVVLSTPAEGLSGVSRFLANTFAGKMSP